jgi:ABC-type uncharacterized transport system ATPase subunit
LNGAPNLNGIAGVRNVQPLAEGRTLELHLEDDANPQTVMREIVSAHDVRSVRLRRLSLEEVFVNLVRRDEGDAAAVRAREELSHV